MMDNKNKNYKVSIGGSMYSVVTDEAEEHVVRSAELVDSLTKKALQASPRMDQTKVVVLVALRLASRVSELEAALHEHSSTHELLIKSIDQLME